MDIDEIFKDIEKTKNKTNTKKLDKKNENSNKKESLESKDSKNKSITNRKYVEGLPIYTLEELKVGQGGDTEDCPFDCDCCY